MTTINSEVNKALETIQRGGVILYPTDTIWGIGCDAANEAAINRIYRIKQRDESKSMIILLPEARDILKYVANPHPDIVSILKGFLRPTTIIYEQAIGLPDNLVNEDGSVAIRVVEEPFCKMLLKRLNRPVVSTSANISGRAAACTFSAIDDAIKNAVDYIVDYRRGEEQEGTASTILRFDGDTLITIRP